MAAGSATENQLYVGAMKRRDSKTLINQKSKKLPTLVSQRVILELMNLQIAQKCWKVSSNLQIIARQKAHVNMIKRIQQRRTSNTQPTPLVPKA